jgi:hypothetical protein
MIASGLNIIRVGSLPRPLQFRISANTEFSLQFGLGVLKGPHRIMHGLPLSAFQWRVLRDEVIIDE